MSRSIRTLCAAVACAAVAQAAHTQIAVSPIGHWSQGIAFSRDGATILVQNMLEKNIQVFRFDGTTLEDTGQRIALSGGGAAIRTAKY